MSDELEEFEEKVKKHMAHGASRKDAEEGVMVSEQLRASAKFNALACSMLDSLNEMNKSFESVRESCGKINETLANLEKHLEKKNKKNP